VKKIKPRGSYVDGVYIPSQLQLGRYRELQIMERIGEIYKLETEVNYSLDINGVHICDYRADHRYHEASSGKLVVEDVKPAKITGAALKAQYEVFKLKAKLMLICHNITVTVWQPSKRSVPSAARRKR